MKGRVSYAAHAVYSEKNFSILILNHSELFVSCSLSPMLRLTKPDFRVQSINLNGDREHQQDVGMAGGRVSVQVLFLAIFVVKTCQYS